MPKHDDSAAAISTPRSICDIPAAPPDRLHTKDAGTVVDLTKPQTIPDSLSSVFSQSQLALAFAIQKSRPDGVSTKQYCSHLRKNVKVGSTNPELNQQHIDASGFWKDQYSMIYQEKKELEKKIRILEEGQVVREQLGIGATEPIALFASGRKRAAECHDAEKWFKQKERDMAAFDKDMTLRLSTSILRLARQREILERSCKECGAPDSIEALSRVCIQTITVLEGALSDCSTPLWSAKMNADRQVIELLQQSMYQIQITFRACFDSLSDLCRTILGRKLRLSITYRMVMFFSMALNHLQTLCSLQAENEADENRSLRHKRARVVEGTEYAVTKYLAKALISMCQMEWSVGEPGHSEILEGLLFFILDHIGRLVSQAIFKEHVAQSGRPGNITNSGPTMPLEAIKLEALHMVQILYAALGKSPDRKELVARVLTEHEAGIDIQLSAKNSSKNIKDMLKRSKEMIQSSLVKSAVDGQELESLRLPTPPQDSMSDLPQPNDSQEKYIIEWLLGSVWALAGWDMVA